MWVVRCRNRASVRVCVTLSGRGVGRVSARFECGNYSGYHCHNSSVSGFLPSLISSISSNPSQKKTQTSAFVFLVRLFRSKRRTGPFINATGVVDSSTGLMVHLENHLSKVGKKFVCLPQSYVYRDANKSKPQFHFISQSGKAFRQNAVPVQSRRFCHRLLNIRYPYMYITDRTSRRYLYRTSRAAGDRNRGQFGVGNRNLRCPIETGLRRGVLSVLKGGVVNFFPSFIGAPRIFCSPVEQPDGVAEGGRRTGAADIVRGPETAPTAQSAS